MGGGGQLGMEIYKTAVPHMQGGREHTDTFGNGEECPECGVQRLLRAPCVMCSGWDLQCTFVRRSHTVSRTARTASTSRSSTICCMQTYTTQGDITVPTPNGCTPSDTLQYRQLGATVSGPKRRTHTKRQYCTHTEPLHTNRHTIIGFTGSGSRSNRHVQTGKLQPRTHTRTLQ
jgi:hypothetical protein